MQPSKPVEKYLRRLAKMQPKTAPLTKEERAAKAARARAARPVDPRNPTRVQLKRITGKQTRRALVTVPERRIRREFLRRQNGQVAVA